jgi:hypothetical protein
MAEILLKVGVKYQLININFLQDYVYTISSNFSSNIFYVNYVHQYAEHVQL